MFVGLNGNAVLYYGGVRVAVAAGFENENGAPADE